MNQQVDPFVDIQYQTNEILLQFSYYLTEIHQYLLFQQHVLQQQQHILQTKQNEIKNKECVVLQKEQLLNTKIQEIQHQGRMKSIKELYEKGNNHSLKGDLIGTSCAKDDSIVINEKSVDVLDIKEHFHFSVLNNDLICIGNNFKSSNLLDNTSHQSRKNHKPILERIYGGISILLRPFSLNFISLLKLGVDLNIFNNDEIQILQNHLTIKNDQLDNNKESNNELNNDTNMSDDEIMDENEQIGSEEVLKHYSSKLLLLKEKNRNLNTELKKKQNEKILKSNLDAITKPKLKKISKNQRKYNVIRITKTNIVQNLIFDRQNVRRETNQEIRNFITKEVQTNNQTQDTKFVMDYSLSTIYNLKKVEGKNTTILKCSIIPVVASYFLQQRKWISLMKNKCIQLCNNLSAHNGCLTGKHYCKKDKHCEIDVREDIGDHVGPPNIDDCNCCSHAQSNAKSKECCHCSKFVNDISDFIICLNLDAASKTNLTTLVMTVINSKCFGSGQSRKITTPLAIWEGEEKEITLIAEELKKEIDILRTKGFTIDNKTYTVEVFLCMDLKALSSICSGIGTGHWCPYCNCLNPVCAGNHSARSMDELGCSFGLPSSNVIVCVLHAKERLCEHALRITLSLITEKEEFWKDLLAVDSLSCLRVIEVEEWNELRIFLHGPTCDALLNNTSVIFKHVKTTQAMNFWTNLKLLLNSIDGGVSNDRLIEIADAFWKSYIEAGNGFQGKCWYVHILVKHLIPLQQRFGSLKAFETQGCESLHGEDDYVLHHGTSKGGGYENTSFNSYFSPKQIDYSIFDDGIKLSNMTSDIDKNVSILANILKIAFTNETSEIIGKVKSIAQILLRKLRILYSSTILEKHFIEEIPLRIHASYVKEISKPNIVSINNNIDTIELLSSTESHTLDHDCRSYCVTQPSDSGYYNAGNKTIIAKERDESKEEFINRVTSQSSTLKPTTNLESCSFDALTYAVEDDEEEEDEQ